MNFFIRFHSIRTKFIGPVFWPEEMKKKHVFFPLLFSSTKQFMFTRWHDFFSIPRLHIRMIVWMIAWNFRRLNVTWTHAINSNLILASRFIRSNVWCSCLLLFFIHNLSSTLGLVLVAFFQIVCPRDVKWDRWKLKSKITTTELIFVLININRAKTN